MDNKLSKPKKLTERWLDAAFEELRKYKATLQEWDDLLTDKEAMLESWEARLLAFTEEHSEEFEDEGCPCDMCRYERIGEDDEDCGMREWDEEEKEAIRKDPDLEQHMRQLKPVRHWGPPPEPVVAAPDAGARKDIVELDKLYALPDRRKGKR